ncbi:MAG: hypothetical protein E6I80_28660 [Chloroflexi bacterium]|nr:MAG: hypothetical protein E6I80_28660 [Chloroflexota bacterium]
MEAARRPEYSRVDPGGQPVIASEAQHRPEYSRVDPSGQPMSWRSTYVVAVNLCWVGQPVRAFTERSLIHWNHLQH